MVGMEVPIRTKVQQIHMQRILPSRMIAMEIIGASSAPIRMIPIRSRILMVVSEAHTLRTASIILMALVAHIDLTVPITLTAVVGQSMVATNKRIRKFVYLIAFSDGNPF